MTGHQSVIDLRRKGKKPRSVFFFFGEYPCPTFSDLDGEKALYLDSFNPENCIGRFEHPEVWIGKSKLHDCDLSFVKNLKVHLLCPNKTYKTSINQYLAWWLSLIKEEPELLIGIDTDGEFNIWRK